MQNLLIDCQYFCYRVWHSANKESTPYMLLSVLEQEAQTAKERFGINRIVFAFDHYESHRKQIQPDYKSTRNKNMTEDDRDTHREFCEQINLVRDDCLPNLGYQNVFCEAGFEADDIIAKIAQDSKSDDQTVILSADKDLWQCLSPNVIWYSPSKGQVMTHRSFAEEWGLAPRDWAKVKAIAGCKTDDVDGIEGVGEVYAAKYLRGELKKGKKYEAIQAEVNVKLEKNLPLVDLPFIGIREFELREDELTRTKRDSVLESLGVEPVRKERRSKRRKGGFV